MYDDSLAVFDYCQIGGTKMILARGKGRLVRDVHWQQHDSETWLVGLWIRMYMRSLSCFFLGVLCQLLGSTDS